MKDFGADQTTKKKSIFLVEKFTLSNKNDEKYRGVFNSTCLPSGNLVEGLPFDLLYGCKRILIRIEPALTCTFCCPVTLLGR